jgi:hypothetical protein
VIRCALLLFLCLSCWAEASRFAAKDGRILVLAGLLQRTNWGADGSMCREQESCAIARLARGKFDPQLGVPADWLKIFRGEVAPHTGDCTRQIDLAKDPELGRQWMENFFAHLEAHRDIIAAIACINEDWSDTRYSPQWQDQADQACKGHFSRSNSRLNDAPELERFWGSRIGGEQFLNWQPDLYEHLER